MSQLAQEVREALTAWRGGRAGVEEIASWADGTLRAWLSDPANRYAYSDDAAVEALGLAVAAAEAPDPAAELEAAQALVQGEAPFSASRLLLLDESWIAQSPACPAAQCIGDMGARLEGGEPWNEVVASLAPVLVRTAQPLDGSDYVQLLVHDAVALCEDLRFAVDGSVEVLGRGRPRLDAALLAERLARIGQVLRAELPLRVHVRARGCSVSVVLSY